MKKFILFAHVYTWVLLLPFEISAQDSLNTYPNYVVIGAFAIHKNAINFTGDANKNSFPAKYEMNPNRNLYYVYVLSTADRQQAIDEALKLRTDTRYFDTWVYSGPLGLTANLAYGRGVDVNPVTGREMNRVNSTSGNDNSAHVSELVSGPPALVANTARSGDTRRENVDASVRQPASRDNSKDATRADGRSNTQHQAVTESLGGDGQPLATSGKTTATTKRVNANTRSAETTSQSDPKNETATGETSQQPMTGTKSGAVESNKSSQEVARTSADVQSTDKPFLSNKERAAALGPPPVRASTEPLSAPDVEGKPFYFYLFRTDNHDMVDGEVDAIDFARSRRMATYKANVPVRVTMPSGDEKQMSFVCQVFGYRKQQIEFDPASLSEVFYVDDKGNLVVPFELMRMQKGDIAIMYNVFFFKDAAVMRPESRYEVNNLLDLLVENPSYRIKIHGHTNGNASGKIIRMNTPGNFYSLSGTKQGFGSAKALSEERAIVIRDFLVNSGIAADRMEIKAWGGKKPIHDKHSVRANENVRVEIEILSD